MLWKLIRHTFNFTGKVKRIAKEREVAAPVEVSVLKVNRRA